jgi:hypothetical protein
MLNRHSVLAKDNFANSSDLLPEDPEIETPYAIDRAILQTLDQQLFASLFQLPKGV